MTNKIMFLGGSANSVGIIEYAKQLGYVTYLCDNTNCPGKKIADFSYDTSAGDVEGVVAIMRQNSIDNVVSYGNDILAVKQAQIAKILNIRGNTVDSVLTLTQKDLFKKFLRENGFNEPYIATFTVDDFSVDDVRLQHFPMMVKPVDSAGSSGVTKVLDKGMLQDAFNYALSYSNCKKVIVEKFIENKYPYVIAGDVVVSNGKVVFNGISSEQRNAEVNPFLPISTFYPSTLTKEQMQTVINEISRLVKAVGFEFGGMNVEMVFDKNDDLYFLELAPRNGGNCISDQIKCSFDVDLRKAQLDVTLNKEIAEIENKHNYITSTFILHSYKNGVLKNIIIDDRIKDKIVFEKYSKQIGDTVEYFSNAYKNLGIIIFKFESKEQLQWFLDNAENLVKVEVK